MRMPMQFSRFKTVVPTGKIALGADSVPNGPPAVKPSKKTQDNLLTSPFESNQGWPAHRIAVGYKGPAGAIPLNAKLVVFDYETDHWYEVGADQNITPDRITYFDVIGLLGTSDVQERPSAGSNEAMLIVSDGATPAGEYVFSMGPDLTTLPI